MPRDRRLLVAIAVSFALHAVLLDRLWEQPPPAPAGLPLLVTIVRPGEAVEPASATVPAPPSQPVQAAVTPELPPAAAPVPVRQPDAPAPVRAAASAPSASPTDSVPAPSRTEAARTGAEPARPLGSPEIPEQLRRDLVARRLALRVTVGGDGTPSQVVFVNPELGAAALAALVEAVSRVRFAVPPAPGGTESVYRGRLCFDDEGLLQGGPECWVPEGR